MDCAIYEALYVTQRLFCWVGSKPDGYTPTYQNFVANQRRDLNS